MKMAAGEPVVLASVRQEVPSADICNGLIICVHYSKANIEEELPRRVVLQQV